MKKILYGASGMIVALTLVWAAIAWIGNDWNWVLELAVWRDPPPSPGMIAGLLRIVVLMCVVFVGWLGWLLGLDAGGCE